MADLTRMVEELLRIELLKTNPDIETIDYLKYWLNIKL